MGIPATNNSTTYITDSASDRLNALMKKHGFWLDFTDSSCTCLMLNDQLIYRYNRNPPPSQVQNDILDWMEEHV